MNLSQHDLAASFDSLRPVGIDEIRGLWHPDQSYAETPGGRVLLDSGWWGMRFTDAESVDPLLFRSADSTDVFAADLPRLLALLSRGPVQVGAHRTAVEAAGPIARVRMVHYRGVLSATLIYDQVPILDYIRALDDNTLVGAVEGRGMTDAPAYAVLRRG